MLLGWRSWLVYLGRDGFIFPEKALIPHAYFRRY